MIYDQFPKQHNKIDNTPPWFVVDLCNISEKALE